ncbi:MAG: aromatic-ring-hydroxylating dioxygenase subunit beta [Pseudonocardia sp.]|jgi:benzoate/toluate 1,2-dioxygenase subunit beta
MNAAAAVPGELVIGNQLDAVRAFVYREARLLDQRRYADWLDIWTGGPEDLYWVPAEDDVAGGDEVISYIYDNVTRLRTRVKQLLTGERYSQVPTSNTVRVVSNLEAYTDPAAEGPHDGGVRVLTSFALHEYRLGRTQIWAGRTEYRLVGQHAADLRMVAKKVLLVDRTGAIPSMAFLL